jgi:hypothetical protein
MGKSVNRKWMKDRPEIESHSMGLHANAVYQIVYKKFKQQKRPSKNNIMLPRVMTINYTMSK